MHGLTHTINTLLHGGIAILPTETVYGLAGRADNPEVVNRIYALKGRDFDNPLALCVENIGMANTYGTMTGLASELAQSFWPGPLSLVVKARGHNKLDSRLYGKNQRGQITISMRCPQADWLASIQDIPLALTSANPSGQPAPLSSDQAAAYLGDGVDAIYSGPPCHVGVSSTILSIDGRQVKILRQGSLYPEDFVAFNIEGDDW